MKPNPRTFKSSSYGMAGWLFADLFLGFSIIFLASVQYIPISATPKPSSTVTPTNTQKNPSFTTPSQTFTPTSIPTPTDAIVPLDLKPIEVFVRVVNVNDFLNNRGISYELLNSLENNFPIEYKNRRAGLVLTYGYTSSNNIGPGRQMAIKANLLLLEYYPEIFSGAVTKAFWWDSDDFNPTGTIKFEIYFFSQP
jgi:hypothetical protein